MMRPGSSILALCVASPLLLACLLSQERLVSASLASFVLGANRPKFFQRQPAGVQQLDQQLHQQQQQQLQPLASHHLQAQTVGAPEPLGIAAHFGAPPLPQADLMRVGQSQMFAQQQQHQPPPQQQQLHLYEPEFALVNNHEAAAFEAQAAGFYRPTIEPPLQQGGRYIPAQNIAAAAAQARGIRLQPSQTQIVDKIERHIDQQIEQSLAADGQTGYEKQQREAAASSMSQPEESEELEEPAAEKRHEPQAEPEEKKPAKEEEEQQQHHHEHSPVEAFEVHHKKGGKSFQYFHQEHSS